MMNFVVPDDWWEDEPEPEPEPPQAESAVLLLLSAGGWMGALTLGAYVLRQVLAS